MEIAIFMTLVSILVVLIILGGVLTSNQRASCELQEEILKELRK